jgi:hypothetical protein
MPESTKVRLSNGARFSSDVHVIGRLVRAIKILITCIFSFMSDPTSDGGSGAKPPRTAVRAIGIDIDVGLESGDAVDQIRSGGVAVMVGEVLAQPVPEWFNRHQIRTVTGQWQQMNAQAGCGGPMTRGALPGDPADQQSATSRQPCPACVESLVPVGQRSLTRSMLLLFS